MTEENVEKSEVYSFDECELDADRRELRCAGNSVTTQPKAFELLLYLVRNRHRAVDKDELQDQLWPRSIVTETALTRCVMKARRAVGDDADRQIVIKTVHGHGYRFIADVRAPAAAPAAAAPAESRSRRLHLPAIAAGLLIGLGALWWLMSPPAYSDAMRLAVLPVENATGEEELDWARTGFMALMNRMLEDRSVPVVGGRSISDLAGERSLQELMAPKSEFRQALAQTTGFTHTLSATLERDGGLYRLTYTIAGGDDRPERRTVVGQKPARLVSQVVDTVTTMMTIGTPELDRMSIVSDDDFINEAYARAMSLEYEGRYEEAQQLFQVILGQNPDLFWPRYEYAICARNLRDFENAERLFIDLRSETQEQGEPKREAAVHNSLGIMYMRLRRNEEALAAFEATVRLAAEADEPKYAATAHQNLGLLAKNLGDIPLAYEHMETSTRIYTELDIQSLPGALLNNMSGVLIQMGNLDAAEQHSLAAIENFRLTGQRLYESYALSRLSSIYRRNGVLDEAEDAAQRAMAVRVELGDKRGIASSILTLSDIALDRGDLTRALQYAQQAQDMGVEIDDPDVIVDALLTTAKAELALGRPHDAAANYAAGEAIARNVGNRQSEFGARYGIARSWIEIGDYDGATAIANELLADSRENARQREETAGLNLHAYIFMAREQWTEAIVQLDDVLRITESLGDNSLVAGANSKLGRCWLELGDTDRAQSYIDAVLVSRPADADVLKLQAQLAAQRGDSDQAVEFMTAARLRAGEGWHDDDNEKLESYRDSVIEN